MSRFSHNENDHKNHATKTNFQYKSFWMNWIFKNNRIFLRSDNVGTNDTALLQNISWWKFLSFLNAEWLNLILWFKCYDFQRDEITITGQRIFKNTILKNFMSFKKLINYRPPKITCFWVDNFFDIDLKRASSVFLVKHKFIYLTKISQV